MKYFILILIFLFVLSTDSIFADIRPKVLAPTKDCELWVGTASGNDPSVLVELRLCFKQNSREVNGVLQWSSERSGWNKRAIIGIKDEAKSSYTLKDISFIEYKPNEGWMFCLIDNYNLSYSNDLLVGTYYSKACQDHAKLSLKLASRR